MTWNCIKDVMPKNNQYVLAWDGTDIYLLKFREDHFESSSDEEYFEEITHWMSLPTAPESS